MGNSRRRRKHCCDMLLTLGQVKTGPVGRSCGIATTSSDFVEYVNDATRQLVGRGNWWATVQPMVLPLVSGHANLLVCPREVESILAVDERYHAQVQNFWHKYVPWGHEILGWFRDLIGGDYDGFRKHHNPMAYNIGTTPVTTQINPANPMYVRATSSSASDVGITVSVFGIDSSGNNVQATLIMAGNPPMQSSFGSGVQFGRVDRVVKGISSGYITLQQDDNNGNLLPLAIYSPIEQTPEYTVMKLERFRQHHHPMTSISVIAKLAFIPVSADTDNVLIENQDALRDMVLSIRKKESGDIQGSTEYEASAIHELNRDMASRFPDEQFVAEYFPNSIAEHRRIF